VYLEDVGEGKRRERIKRRMRVRGRKCTSVWEVMFKWHMMASKLGQVSQIFII
jgi:hypothetical protein